MVDNQNNLREKVSFPAPKIKHPDLPVGVPHGQTRATRS